MPTSTDTKAQGKQKARKTIDCYPEKSEYRSKTAGKLCLEYVEKKLSLLGQKKEKMDIHKEKLENGEKLDQAALDSLDKYDKISHDHYVTEGIYKRLVDITDKHKKTMEDMNKKESDRIEEILKLQYTLDQFGGEEVREDFLKGKRGAVLLTQDNLDQLDALYQAISPMRSGGYQQEKGKPFDPSKLYAAASEHLVKYLDGDDGVVVGSTYKNLRKLVAQINKCGYFKRLQRIQFLEAAKEGGKRSKKTRKTKDGESEEREAQPATDDKSLEHTDKIAQPSEEHKSQTVNTTEQDAFFAPSSSPYQQPSSTGSASASFSSQSAISSSTDVNNTASSSQPDIQSFTHNRPFQFIQTSYVMPDSSSPSVFDPAVIVAQPAGAYGLQFMSPLYDTNTTGVAATNNSSPAVGQQQQQQQQTHHQQSPSQQHQQQQQQQHHHHPHHHQQHQQQPPQPTQPQRQQQQHHHQQHPHQAMPAPGLAGLSSQQAQPQSGPTMAPSAPSVNALGMPVDLSQGPVDLSQSSMVKQQPQQHQQQQQHRHHQQQQEFNVQSSFPQSESLFPTPSGSHTNDMSPSKLPGGPNTHSESRGSNSTSTSLPSMNNYDIPPSIPMPPSQQEPGQEPQEKKSPMNANAPVFQSMYAAQQQQQQQQQQGGNMSSRHQTPPSSSDIPPVPHTPQSASDYNMPSNTFGGPSGDFVTNDFQSGYQGSNGFANGNYGRGGPGGGNRGGYRGPRGGSAGTGGPANNMNSRNGGGSYQNYGPGPNTGYRSDNFQSGGYGSSSFGNANSYVKRGGMNSGMGGPGNPGYPPRPAGMGPNPNRGAMRGGMPRGGPRGGPHRAGFGRPQ